MPHCFVLSNIHGEYFNSFRNKVHSHHDAHYFVYSLLWPSWSHNYYYSCNLVCCDNANYVHNRCHSSAHIACVQLSKISKQHHKIKSRQLTCVFNCSAGSTDHIQHSVLGFIWCCLFDCHVLAKVPITSCTMDFCGNFACKFCQLSSYICSDTSSKMLLCKAKERILRMLSCLLDKIFFCVWLPCPFWNYQNDNLFIDIKFNFDLQ